METQRYKYGKQVVLARFWLPFWEPKWSKIETRSDPKRELEKRHRTQRGPCSILVPKVTKYEDMLEPIMVLFCEKSEMNENVDFCTSLKRDAHLWGSEALKMRDFRDKEGVKNESPKKKDPGKHFC